MESRRRAPHFRPVARVRALPHLSDELQASRFHRVGIQASPAVGGLDIDELSDAMDGEGGFAGEDRSARAALAAPSRESWSHGDGLSKLGAHLATFRRRCKPMGDRRRFRFIRTGEPEPASRMPFIRPCMAHRRRCTQVPATLLAGRHQNALNWPMRSEDADPGETAVQRTLRINRKRDTMAGHKPSFGPGSPRSSGALFCRSPK